MKKILFTTMVLFGFCSIAHSQIEEKMQKEGVVQGAIFNKNGEEIAGYIKVKKDVYGMETKLHYPAPWSYQDDIQFISKDVFDNTPEIKKKLYKKYGPKDINGYRYEELYFEAVKYADMSAVGLNMFPKWMFLRRIIDGKISVFYYYDNPPSVLKGETFEPYYVKCAQEQVVYRKSKDGKLKLIEGVVRLNICKDWEDCPLVKEKYDGGAYPGSRLEQCLQAIKDYNENCN
jgi:hypothetical protein